MLNNCTIVYEYHKSTWVKQGKLSRATLLNCRLDIRERRTLIMSFCTILSAWGAVFSTGGASRTPWLTLGYFRSKLRSRRQWNGYSLCESAKRVRALYCGSPRAWLWETRRSDRATYSDICNETPSRVIRKDAVMGGRDLFRDCTCRTQGRSRINGNIHIVGAVRAFDRPSVYLLTMQI